ncbi:MULTISPECIES: MarR family winged helix-turn-helix transcriptional regulator [unclassified Ruegeria]|uniref:MarR family winged helix-turn-helix transcriptional regulator n=1 Tax=unclassified Ruegeria TaxID=2625375 RepID=UPI00148993FD|nr:MULTISPECIES: MarR family transcriptional regulator [unclassified Ruegeria]
MTSADSDKKDEFDLRVFLPYLLNRAAEESSLEFQRAYKDRYGMLRTEWRVLFHLGNYGEMTAKEIGERARIHKTKISRAVSRLEQRRYLLRKRSDTDRRVEILTLTVAGQTVYRELCDIAQRYDEKLAGMFSADEVALLRQMLRRLADMV